MTSIRPVLSFVLACAVSVPLFAQTTKPNPAQAPAAKVAPAPSARDGGRLSVAPLPTNPAPFSSHAPFLAGDCRTCHQNSDPKQPGPVLKKGPAPCLECHEEFAEVIARKVTHDPARTDCTNCHNPHNAVGRRLLVQDTQALCIGCHDKIGKTAKGAAVPHKAVSTGAQCVNCHDPHGSAVAKLLLQLPFDLCLGCHNVDTMADSRGKKLQNTKAWLDGNKVRHGPVRSKDCSACHQPHGSDNFRLLEEAYPAAFYAPFDARSYALCFSCHIDDAFSTPKTTTLTNFRNGDQNLHYFHLNIPGRGRTCRACHEVHAGKQELMIRDEVPFGSSGWMLKLNFTKTATGGSCDKTCHSMRTYVNRQVDAVGKTVPVKP